MDAERLDIAKLAAALADGALVLTPNHRTALQLREVHGRQRAAAGLCRVGASPAIFAVDIWLRRAWGELQDGGLAEPAFLLDPLHELLVWKDIIEHSAAGHAFLNLEAAARKVREAHALMRQWEIAPGELLAFSRAQPDSLAGSLTDTGIFLQWLEDYENRCRAQRLASLSQLIPTCIGALEDGRLCAPRLLVLHGFRNPPPLYRRLFDTLARLAQGNFILDHEVSNPRIRKVAAGGAAEELEAAARWAHAILDADPRARIGIVCPDLQQRSAETARIFAGVFAPAAAWQTPASPLPFALSSGETLDAAPMLDAALAILELNGATADTLEFCRLLRSPFIAGADAEADARAELEYRLRRQGEQRIGLADLRLTLRQEGRPWHCPTLAAGMLALENLHRQARGRRPPGEWIALLERQLEALGWPGGRPLDHRERGILAQWSKSLSALREAGFLAGEMEYAGILPLLRSLLRNTRLGGAEARAPVQILGPVEADAMHFSHLWFMGLCEQNWPPAARPNPFLPVAVQKRHQVPEADIGRHGILAGELLRELLAGTETEAVLSHPLRGEEGELAPAAALLEIPGAIESLDAAPAWGLHPLIRQALGAATLENHAGELRIPLLQEGTVGGGTGLLTSQSNCPFRGFAIHRLNARELPLPAAGLSAPARGELLHTALQTFWNALKDQGALLALDEAALDGRLREAIDAALRDCARDYPLTLTPRFRELEAERLLALLRQWMEKERERGWFQVSHTEQKVQWRHADLVLDFRIDRIETLEDGTLGLVDYKSGRVGSLKWHEERPENPQLLLYLLAVEKELRLGTVSALLFARVNIEENGFRGIAARPGICAGQELEKRKDLPEGSTWESLKRHWEGSLQALADEFIAGKLAVAPRSPHTCQYCHLDSLCRIAELPPEEIAE